jgi:hypothetical protein
MLRVKMTIASLLMGGFLVSNSAQAQQDRNESRAATAADYESVAQQIITATLAGNSAYAKLEELCDGIGNRLSGSEALTRALDWAVHTFEKDGQENVHQEPVMVPRWVRGSESLVMLEPRAHTIVLLGLGGSVGTPPEGITGEVVVVRDEAELEALGDGAKDKIVLFNNPMPPYDPEKGSGYGTAVRFRGNGARLAAGKGAVACLIRSVTATSLRSPHTGAMRYGDAARKIPAAAISIEDAEMIARLTARGQHVVVRLNMEARDEGLVPSANVVAELRGRTHPEEIVVIGGHIDSWDVGQGAQDDGVGSVMCMEALNVLRKLKLTPRRTIRVVLWTNEENGLAGARQYAKDHADELSKHVAAIEADSGCFRPTGFSLELRAPREGEVEDPPRRAPAEPATTQPYRRSESAEPNPQQDRAVSQMLEIVHLLEPLGSMKVSAGGSGADVGPMRPAGVPLLGFEVEGSKYFDYHHSQADTLDKIDRQDLAQCVAAMAVTAYVLADMPGRLGEPQP